MKTGITGFLSEQFNNYVYLAGHTLNMWKFSNWTCVVDHHVLANSWAVASKKTSCRGIARVRSRYLTPYIILNEFWRMYQTLLLPRGSNKTRVGSLASRCLQHSRQETEEQLPRLSSICIISRMARSYTVRNSCLDFLLFVLFLEWLVVIQ
jgi:hypothetical protein